MRRLRRILTALACMLPASAAGQEVTLTSSLMGFSFDDPSSIGLRSYRVGATELGVAHRVRPWLTAGTTVAFARASVKGVSRGAQVSGPTDVSIDANAFAGPIRLRGSLLLGVGRTSLSTGAHLASGLASYELLPIPVRGWGRGGGYLLEVGLPFRNAGLDFDLTGGWSAYNAFTPFEGTGVEYRIGREIHAGVRVGRSLTEWNRVEVGGRVVFPASDRLEGRELFSPGARLAVYAVGTFSISRTAVLLRADLYRRSRGSSSTVPAVNAPARRLGLMSIQTRTRAAGFVVVASAEGRLLRFVDGEARGWLVGGSLGLEREIRGPWPGRLFVTPGGALRRGHFVVAEGYESSALGWEVSLGAQWERGR